MGRKSREASTIHPRISIVTTICLMLLITPANCPSAARDGYRAVKLRVCSIINLTLICLALTLRVLVCLESLLCHQSAFDIRYHLKSVPPCQICTPDSLNRHQLGFNNIYVTWTLTSNDITQSQAPIKERTNSLHWKEMIDETISRR